MYKDMLKMNLQLFALSANATKKVQTVVPEVMAPIISAELPKKIKFYPLVDVDTTLQGVPGDTVTVPKWGYIGAAEDVAEGQPIPIGQLTTKKSTMTIKKAGKGVEISDEAQLSGLGDPIGEGRKQITMAIADKIDNDIITALTSGAKATGDERAVQTKALTGGKLTVTGLESALAMFDDEDDIPTVLICNPADAMDLRMDAQKNFLSATELGANRFVSGVFGEVLGVQIIRTRKLAKGTSILFRKGAARLMMKRNVEIESDRDIIVRSTVITGDEHYGVYLYDPRKTVNITIGV